MEILLYPDPALTRRATPVERVDESVAATAREMLEAMHAHRGIGLAGPQVGYGFRLFVMNLTGTPDDDRVLVNPEILEREGEAVGEEGCLSFPGLHAKIARAVRIRYRATDLAGKTEEREAYDHAARVIQHETDHLDGVLFTRRASPAEKQALSPQLKELERRYWNAHPDAARGRKRARVR